MHTIIEKMDELIARNKKKSRLNNEEGMKAQTFLEPLLKNPQYREQGYAYMLALPADISGNIFMKVWLESEELDRKEIVSNLLKYKEFSGEAGYNRLMELCKLFNTVSQPVAFQFLVTLSKKMTSKGTLRPAVKFLTKFRNHFMKGDDLLKIPIGNYDVDSEGITSVATLVFYCLLSLELGDSKQDANWKKLYLSWLGQCHSRPFLPLINDIEKMTAKWPEDLQRFGVEKGLLKTVTTMLLDRGDNNHTSNKPENDKTAKDVENKEHIQSVPTGNIIIARSKITKKVITEDNNIEFIQERDKKPKYEKRFNALLYLEQLGQHIKELEGKIKKTELELIDSRLEVQNQRRSREILINKLAGIEKNLQTAEADIQNLELKLKDSYEVASQLKIQLEDMKNKHEKETTDLLEMIDNRSIQAIHQLKNRVVQLLRTDYQDFKQIDKDEMTIELGENLRFQIASIFKRLLEEDIRF